MKKKLLSLLLSLSLCVSLLPAALAEGEAPRTYDQAVAELRSKTGHSNEHTMETDECTIFTFDRGGFMNAPQGMMVLIYKPGSQLGEGTTIELPHARTQVMNVTTPADVTTLSADQKTFSYSYLVSEPIVVNGQEVQKAGTFTYVVDLPTGEVTERFTPLSYVPRDETYLISITTADGVVTSGYRDEWRWVALGRADPGRPGILLYESWGNPDVHGSLKRSDAGQPGAPQSGEELTAWGKAQDGKPATLTLGKESWACTARYQEYYGGKERVLYVEFPPYDAKGSHQPDSDTIWLFRYDWEQEAAGKYAAALASLTQEEGYVTDQQLETVYRSTVVLRHKEAPAVGGEAAYQDYELYLVARRAYYEEDNIKRLLLPSTTLVGDYAPTHRAPDSLTVSGDGDTLTYVYAFDSPLSRPDGEVLHEAGTYEYTVDVGTGELTVSHSPAQAQTPPAADPGGDGFADVPAGSWFEKGVTTCAGKGVMVGTGEGRFSPDSQLTAAECLTLALRLYDLRRGGDGMLQKAPEEWGKYTLTLADGTVFTRWGEQTSSFHSGHFDPYNDGWGVFAVAVVAPGDTAEEQLAWAKAHEGPAVFTAEGKSYSGAVAVEPDGYDGPELRFGCEEEPHSGSLLSNCKPGPDRWYRDVVYTVKQLGLGEADGFSSLLGYLSYGSPDAATASRESFAKALAVAAGELEKKYDVTIPDVDRTEYTENIYRLYEAGILGGSDAFGTFQADKMLTRAECAVMVARVLDPAQRLTEPPAAPETAYDQKLIDLRRGFGYYNERLFDTDICTVVVRDYGGMMHAQKGCITVVYKPGSAKGDGFTVSPPHPGNNYSPLLSRNPDHMELSGDKKTFTYSYHFAQPFLSNGRIVRPAGDFVYTVDLPTGTVTEDIPQVDESVNTYTTSLERFLTDCAEKGYTVEETVEAPLCSLLFCSSPIEENGDRSYLLYAVYKTDVDADVGGNIWHTAEGEVKSFSLPTTRVDEVSRPGAPMIYTHHMPDSMALSEDGNAFTVTYSDPYESNPHTMVFDLRSGLSEAAYE